jgi:hypothetical protein
MVRGKPHVLHEIFQHAHASGVAAIFLDLIQAAEFQPRAANGLFP